MIEIIMLVIITCVVSVILLHITALDKEIPQHNAMDKYNKRLSELEDKFAYHIQSTDEFKSK